MQSKPALWLALAIGFSGGLQASSISETLTGTISSGIDTLGSFGGGDLTGDAFTFSFSYDTGLLINDAALGTDGSFYTPYGAAGPERYEDRAGDDAIFENVTINSDTFALTNNFAGGQGFVYGCSGGCLEVVVLDNNPYISGFFFTTLDYSAGAILSQSAITALIDSLYFASISVSNGTTTDTFDLGSVTVVSGTPEPSTWISSGLATVGFVLVKRRRMFILRKSK